MTQSSARDNHSPIAVMAGAVQSVTSHKALGDNQRGIKAMTYYAILDTNAGLLQWAGTAESENVALAKFADEVGDVNLDSLRVYQLTTRHQYRKVLKWWNAGGKSNEAPDCIK